MRHAFFSFLAGILLFAPHPLNTAMTGGDYEIFADTVSVLDGELATGGDYAMFDTSGEFFATSTSGGTLTLRGGFQAAQRTGISITLSKTTLNLGTLLLTSVATDSVTLTAGTEAVSGLSIAISEDGELRDGSGNSIDDIGAGGTVAAGTEGYGIRTDGNGALGSGTDTPISGSVTVYTSPFSVANAQTTVTFRAAIGNQSRAGSYSHSLTFTATVNP